ncbi:PD40 domain-containing protein [Candidatus Poribacteria bacterium]|nr:PD40 domain-containing protein [Candidatus Poribacteria bacterium]
MDLTKIFHSFGLILVCLSFCNTWAKAPKTAKIVFTSADEISREIYLMNPDGSGQVNITNHPADDLFPTWSPTGEEILFVSDRVRMRDLYLMDADGGNVRRIFSNPAYRHHPTWSPDGKQIAYERIEANERFIYTATIEGKHEEQLGAGVQPAWSPNTQELAFCRQRRIVLINLRTRVEKKLRPDGIAWQSKPAWSPAGDKLAFSWILQPIEPPPGVLPGERFVIPDAWFDNETIFIVKRDGTRLEQIVNEAGPEAIWPTWSPDGTELIYNQQVRGYFQLFKINLANRVPEQLTHTERALQANTLADWFNPAYALPVSPQPQLLTTIWAKMKKK